MPLHNLTPQERQVYSTIPGDIDEPSLRRFFVLSAADERLMSQVRGPHNRLGLAHHLGWLRWLGRQPGRDEVHSGPASLTLFLARQLNVAPEAFQLYPRDRGAWSHHQALAREHLGWRAWSDTERQALLAWLIAQAQQHDQPRGLVKEALGFLRREKIVRPGLTTVERLVAHAREEAGRLLERHVHERLLRPQMKAMDAVIQPTGSGEASRLTEILAAPPNATARSLNRILARIAELRELGVEEIDLSGINANRRKVFAREAQRLSSYHLRRLQPERRFTLLACALSERLRTLNDEAVLTHGQLLREMIQRSAGRRDKQLLQKKRTIQKALQLLTDIGDLLFDADVEDKAVRRAIVPGLIRQPDLEKLLKECEALIAPSETNELMHLNASYAALRQFAPRFLRTLSLRATEQGHNEWRAIAYARRLEEDRKTKFIDPPMEVVPYKWRKLMTASSGQINRRLWEIALHLRLAESLKAGDIWVEHSGDYMPISEDLNLASEHVSAFVDRNPHLRSAPAFLRQRRVQYHEVLEQAVTVWPDLTDVRIEDGHLVLSPLSALDEPPGTRAARERLYSLVPRRKIAQVLREVQNWVDFLEPLRAAAGDDVRVDNLDERLLAVVMAEGCNIGLANMAESTRGMSYIQLAKVANRCLAPEHIEQAIARVIDYFGKHIGLASHWGDGIWSGSDGQLVPVPVRSLYARLHPKAPKGKRVVNFLTYVLDQLMPYWGQVIETTAHESAHEIDGLLHHEADVHPRRQATDNAGYTDNVFGIASLLSIFYAPRIKSLDETVLYCFDKQDKKRFEPVGQLLSAKLNTGVIEAQWDNLMRLVAACERGHTTVARVLRKLEAAGPRSDLYRALQEVGRIEKTVYITTYLTSPDLRRQVTRQLNKNESYHSLANALFWGQKGELRLRDLEDQRNRHSCLRLMAAVVILFNAAYLQASQAKWRSVGYDIPGEQLAHIYPIASGHIRMHGDFYFRNEAKLITKVGALPVREPDADDYDIVAS